MPLPHASAKRPDPAGLSLPVAVTYEDRPDALAGVELLARTLARQAPQMRLWVYSPRPEIAERLADLPQVAWRRVDLAGKGWNAKPAILSQALADLAHERAPESQAVWIDSDIVVTGDVAALLSGFDPATLVVSEDHPTPAAFDSEVRARAYGLDCRRILPEYVNSGVVMVSGHHRALLKAWSDLLEGPEYRAAQTQPRETRPSWFFGDQDGLWAVLLAPPFDTVPIHWLRRGRDIVLHRGANGYRPGERLLRLAGVRPALAHMLGPLKPWSFEQVPAPRSQPADYVHLVSYEVSPVFRAAQPHAAALGHPPWLRRRTLPGRILAALFLGNPALAGLPLSLVAESAARVRRWRPLGRSRTT